MAACPLSRRNGSPRCILLPWCTGIRPKPYAGDSTGDRSSGGYAKIGFASGVYIPRNGHICLACIALIRNVTFPLSVNDNNNWLSVIGSYWSDKWFRVLHSGMYALLKLLSSRPPRAPSSASATVHSLHSLFGTQHTRAVPLFCADVLHAPHQPWSGVSDLSWLLPDLVQPRSTVLTCAMTTSSGVTSFVCFIVQMDQCSIWYGDEETVFPFKSNGQRPLDTERAAPSLETCRSSHFIKMSLRSCLPCLSSFCTVVGASVSLFILPM